MAFKPKAQDVHADNLSVLKDRIKAKDFGGCYVFYGEEEYTKNHYCRLITSESGSILNQTTFYGEEFTAQDIISACSTNAVESFDMFSLDNEEETQNDSEKYRVIKLIDPDFSVCSKNDAEYLTDFLCNLPEKTIVIIQIHAGNEEAVTKGTLKKIAELALTVNFKKEAVGSSILITWILRHFSKEKINVERHVALHLCQTVGNSMTDLKNEIDKLIDFLRYENRNKLECADIDFICIKSVNAQIFEISSGALAGDFTKAARALNVLRDKREKPILILGTISKAVNDLCITDHYIKQGIAVPAISKITSIPDFIVKNSAAILTNRGRDFGGNNSFPKTASLLCMEYDKKLKSSRTDGYELLLELIFKLSFAGKSVT